MKEYEKVIKEYEGMTEQEYFSKMIHDQNKESSSWTYVGRIIYNEIRFAHFQSLFGSDDLIFTKFSEEDSRWYWCIGLPSFSGNITCFDKYISVIEFIKMQLFDRDYGTTATGKSLIRSMVEAKAKLEGMSNWIEFDEEFKGNYF